MKEKEEVKCARKTRAERRRENRWRGRLLVHVPENWPPCRLSSLFLSLSLSLSLSLLFFFLFRPLLPSMPPPICTTTRYRSLHFLSSRASAQKKEETKRESTRGATKERKKNREKERKGKREAEVHAFCARGKIKSLSDAPVSDIAIKN